MTFVSMFMATNKKPNSSEPTTPGGTPPETKTPEPGTESPDTDAKQVLEAALKKAEEIVETATKEAKEIVAKANEDAQATREQLEKDVAAARREAATNVLETQGTNAGPKALAALQLKQGYHWLDQTGRVCEQGPYLDGVNLPVPQRQPRYFQVSKDPEAPNREYTEVRVAVSDAGLSIDAMVENVQTMAIRGLTAVFDGHEFSTNLALVLSVAMVDLGPLPVEADDDDLED